MRLLFDENLSEELSVLLADLYPASLHVRLIGLVGADDARIVDFAMAHKLIIVSKDSDFVDGAILSGPTHQIIWVRLGNCTTASVHLLLRNSFDRIRTFAASKDTVLELP